MNFQPINKEAEATFKGIERRIFRLQSGGTIDSLRTIGADTSGQIGASFVSLKQLASCYAPDETCARRDACPPPVANLPARGANHGLLPPAYGDK